MMDRARFMQELEKLLADISETERQDALDFYNSYFDDAGVSLTVQSVTDHFTDVNQSRFLVVEIQHLMMLFTWRMWQRKYM